MDGAGRPSVPVPIHTPQGIPHSPTLHTQRVMHAPTDNSQQRTGNVQKGRQELVEGPGEQPADRQALNTHSTSHPFLVSAVNHTL